MTASTRRDPRALVRIAALVVTATALLAVTTSQASAQEDRPRVRFGLSGVGGGFVGAAQGGFGGLSLRAGAQFNDVFAVYLQGQGLIGRFVPGPDEQLAGFAYHTLMFEVTLGDVFQIGMGPALDFVWGCTDANQPSCVGSGPYLGGDARVAFLVGTRGPGRRSGFAISFDVHPTWFGNDAAVALLLGLGYEAY